MPRSFVATGGFDSFGQCGRRYLARPEQVAINATGIVQDDGIVGVTLSPYQPQRFRNMTMTMAVLLSDSNFQTSWIAVDNKVDNASGMFDCTVL